MILAEAGCSNTLKSHVFGVRYFRENKFSREFIFANMGKFAKFSSREIFKNAPFAKSAKCPKKKLFREIRENSMKTSPREIA